MAALDQSELEIEDVSYCVETLTFSKDLRIANRTNSALIYKIKTNQKNIISLPPASVTGCLKPAGILNIPMKMVEKPADDAVIKLEINYAVASEQALLNHDFKLPKASNENIRKKVITLQRKGQQGLLKPKSIQDTLAEEVVKYKLTNMSTHLHSEQLSVSAKDSSEGLSTVLQQDGEDDQEQEKELSKIRQQIETERNSIEEIQSRIKSKQNNQKKNLSIYYVLQFMVLAYIAGWTVSDFLATL